MTIRETDLYEPVKRYLEHQGYTVNAEVAGCDVTARKDDELVLIELKTSFSTALLVQAIKRQRVSDTVYVAIPVRQGRKWPHNIKGIRLLLRRLELGLILVAHEKIPPFAKLTNTELKSLREYEEKTNSIVIAYEKE